MQRRSFIGLLAITPLVGLAACGDDADSTPATVPPVESTLPPADEGYEHPTGSDDVVVRITYEGGFTTPEVNFQNLPSLLVSGDGRSFQQGATILIFPGPLVPSVFERPISEAGIQQLLGLADAKGLFSERTYARNDQIADAPDTVVTINVDGQTFVHRAYALGIDGDETDEGRRALAEFVAEAQELVGGPADDIVGPETAFEPDSYLVRGLVVGDWAGEDGIEPRLVDWPADASISLAGEPGCVEAPAAEFAELFETADQLTWFVEGGNTYQVFVKPRLPGDSC